MTSSLLRRESYFVMFVGFMLLMLLAACGGNTSASSSSTSTSNSSNGANVNATPTAAALIKEMIFVGSPRAKIVSGTTFEVDGKLKNGDDKQHDIYVDVK